MKYMIVPIEYLYIALNQVVSFKNLNMQLTRIIIHEIIKAPQSYGATHFLSQNLLIVNDDTLRLTSKLNTAFSKDDNSYGNFNTEANDFYTLFSVYQNVLTDENFVAFSIENIKKLSDTLSRIFFAKGGFFVFCEYKVNNVSFIGVFLVRDIEGVLFNKDNQNQTFRINEIRYLDTNKLAMGARINIQKLTDGDNNHIALTKSSQADISDYFIEWIGLTRPESNADFTNKLFQIVSSIERPLNPNTNEQYALNDFREVVYNMVKASENKVVNLRELGRQIFGVNNENRLIEFAEANNYELDHEFRYDGRALNKFKRITVNRDGIRLSFARGDFERKINLSANDNELVTIRSRSLAESIRQQIAMQ